MIKLSFGGKETKAFKYFLRLESGSNSGSMFNSTRDSAEHSKIRQDPINHQVHKIKEKD
jgi:hypothetical protein